MNLGFSASSQAWSPSPRGTNEPNPPPGTGQPLQTLGALGSFGAGRAAPLPPEVFRALGELCRQLQCWEGFWLAAPGRNCCLILEEPPPDHPGRGAGGAEVVLELVGLFQEREAAGGIPSCASSVAVNTLCSLLSLRDREHGAADPLWGHPRRAGTGRLSLLQGMVVVVVALSGPHSCSGGLCLQHVPSACQGWPLAALGLLLCVVADELGHREPCQERGISSGRGVRAFVLSSLPLC